MANGAKFVLDVEVTDTTIPVLRKDPILTNGSLVLMDNSNPSITPPSVIPASNPATAGVIPNVAWEEAKAIFGSGDVTSLGFSTLNTYTASSGKVEMTAKKGVHAIISQVNHTARTQTFNIVMPAVYRQYFYDNSGHKFYVSVWRKKTRLPAAGVDWALLGLLFGTTSVYMGLELVALNANGGRITMANMGTNRRIAAVDNDLNPYFKNVSSGGGTIGTPAANTNTDASNFLFALGGQISAYTDTYVLNKLPSVITYRVYIEDQTVSGRSYAEIDAIDKALYDAAFAVGGKFYGDTFTDPATLP